MFVLKQRWFLSLNAGFDGEWLIFLCSESPPDSDPKHPDFIPPAETRIVAVNTVEKRHKYLQPPTLEKYRLEELCSFKAKDKKMVGLFEDGQVIVWDLISGSILYQFHSYQFESTYRHDPEVDIFWKPGLIQSFDLSKDEIIVCQKLSSQSDGLMVWKKTSQSDRFCNATIEFVSSNYREINLAVWFGQAVGPKYGGGRFKFKSLEERVGHDCDSDCGDGDDECEGDDCDDDDCDEDDCDDYDDECYGNEILYFHSPTLLVTTKRSITKVFDLLDIQQFLAD